MGIWWPGYWWSASVLTMTSAPRRRQASSPAMKPAASPLRRVNRTTWSAPCARATSAVPSVEPSSMIRTSTTSMPGDGAGDGGERRGQRRLLVQAGDLDDELHACARRSCRDTRNRSTGPGSAVNAARACRSAAPRQAE